MVGAAGAAAAVWAFAALGEGVDAAPTLAAALLAGATAAWAFGASRPARRAGAALGVLLALRLLGFAGAPVLSDDIHRYVHEGRASRVDLALPYAVAPSALDPPPPPDDGTSALVNHPEIPAAYPPLSQLFFLATVSAGDALSSPRVFLRLGLVLCDALVVVLLFARRRERPRAFLLYGLHPLPLLEVGLGAHLDALGVGLLAAGALLAAAPTWLRGALLGLAAGVKPIALLGLIALPLRRRALVVGAAGFVLGVLLPTLPYLAVDAPLGRGLVEYGTRWEAQPTLYAALDAVLAPPFAAREADGRWAHAHVHAGGVLVEEAGVPRLALFDARPVDRPLLLDARVFARGVALALLLAALAAVVRLRSPAARAAWAFAALWLLAPTMHPWYLLWLLPFAAWVPARGLLAWAAVTPLAYEAAIHFRVTGEWEEAWWPRAVGLLALTLGTALDVRRARREARAATSPPAEAG